MWMESWRKNQKDELGDRLRWWSRRTWTSPPLISTLKIHLRVAQFLLKTNYKLAERHPAHTAAWAKWMLQPHLLQLTAPHWSKIFHDQGENSAMGRRGTQTQGDIWAWRGLASLTFAWAELQGQSQSATAVRPLQPTPHICRKPMRAPPVLWHGLTTRGSDQLWRTKDTQTHWQLPLLVVVQRARWRHSRPLSVARPQQPVPHYKLRAHTGHSCSNTAPLWSRVTSAGRQENTHVKETERAWT